MKPEELMSRIRGPVYPMVIPFMENEDVDHEALAAYTDHLIRDGAGVLLLTVGTSRFNLLTGEEMRSANRTVVEAARGRAVVVAAGPGPGSGSTRENVLFARDAESAGADGILLMYPERWYGDEAVVDFFREVAASTGIGLLIHAVAMRDGFGAVHDTKPFDADLIEKVLDEVPSVAGVKEENGDRQIFEEILRRHNSRIPIIGAGGAMRRFIGDHDLGSYTYLVGVGSIRPRLSEDFFSAVTEGNTDAAESIARTSEDVFFPVAMKYGWHRSLKAALSLRGLMGARERAPLTSLRADEIDQVQVAVARFTSAEEGVAGA